VSVLIGLDPGPETSGVVVYRAGGSPQVLEAHAKLDWPGVRQLMNQYPAWSTTFLCERVSAGAISGKHILQTSEVCGRFMEYADSRNLKHHLYYRREVLAALGVGSGASKDALVRQVVLELHPEGTGSKKKPGPLFGVATHAWQALGLACAHALLNDLYKEQQS
jgi:hypothetical protein